MAFDWKKHPLSIDIGSSVTTIGDSGFNMVTYLKSIIIQNPEINIEAYALGDNAELTNVTFKGKTLAQVQAMDNYPWGISNTSIINVA